MLCILYCTFGFIVICTLVYLKHLELCIIVHQLPYGKLLPTRDYTIYDPPESTVHSRALSVPFLGGVGVGNQRHLTNFISL